MYIYSILCIPNGIFKILENFLLILFWNLFSFLKHLDFMSVDSLHIVDICFSIPHLIIQKLNNQLDLVNLWINCFGLSWFLSELLDELNAFCFILVH